MLEFGSDCGQKGRQLPPFFIPLLVQFLGVSLLIDGNLAIKNNGQARAAIAYVFPAVVSPPNNEALLSFGMDIKHGSLGKIHAITVLRFELVVQLQFQVVRGDRAA